MDHHLKLTKKKKKIQNLKNQIEDIRTELDGEKSKNGMLMNILNDLRNGVIQKEDLEFLLDGLDGNTTFTSKVGTMNHQNDDFATQELINQLINEENSTKKDELDSEELIKRLIEEDKKKLQEELDKKTI